MKILKQLVIILITLLAFGACQKDLNFADGVSIGTLKSDVTGDCLPITVNGIFLVDSVLTDANYVDVEINAAFGGTFEVKSDTIAGFSFSRTGNVGTGINTVRLYPSGKPDSAGLKTFTIQYDSTFCTFTINVIASTAGGAVYSLGGAPGNCSGFNVFGAYIAGTALNSDDSITFLVNVSSTTLPGTYNITTGSPVNGMTFSGTGVFINSGIQTVTLKGSGTPLAAGTNISFSPTGGGTTCAFTITVLPAGTSSAAFTFNGGPAPGTCSGAALHGSYIAGTMLTASNNVDLFVNVTAPGTYFITTGPGSVNGMIFSKTGTFSGTGSQMVTLTGTGTPANTIAANFTVTGSTSSCIFSITTTSGTSTNSDYIPETLNNNWTDSLDGGTVSDTTYTYVTPNTSVRSGQTYRDFLSMANFTAVDSTLHRKTVGKYYEYIYDNYQGMYDFPINAEVLLLDSTVALNGTWTIALPPNARGGVPVNIKIDAQIIAKGATVTVANNVYNNVIKVKFTYSMDPGTGFTAYKEEEFWYARGLGLLYDKKNDLPVTTTVTRLTKRIQVF